MKIALMGNPNSGKTTLYNVLTEDQEYIGNYAKVTANKKEAKLKENLGNNIDIIELPDVYSIREYTSKESITRDFIKAENPDVIINIVYSTNLNRSLFLTTQLLELNIPVVVALNKVDISKDVMDIDINKLEENLACKVVEISLSKNEGLENLITQAIESSKLKSQECLFENLLNIQSEKEQDKERYNIVNNIISKVENRKIIENEETLEDNIDKFVTNPIIKIGLFILIVVLIISLGFKGVTITTAFIEEKRQEQIENQKKIKAERLEEEIKRKESEEAKKRMVGVVHEARKYTYDAIKIQQRLDNYDYSNNGDKIVFLTFDDGSSTTVTQQILKTLKEHDVRATFFVTGQTIENGGQKAKDLIKESFNYGNAIANHSWTHDYHTLYPNRTLDLDSFLADFKKTDDLLKKILGPYFSTRVIRCPGGHMSWKGMEPLDEYLNKNNMASIDWNALNKDAEGRKKNADELVQNAINTSQGKDIVVLLMHDTYGKEETAKALPRIIQYFKDNGYEFKTLS